MLKKLAEPFVVGVSARILGQVISFISVAVASRYLDLEVFGTYALAWAAAVIGNTFIFTGFYQALLRSRRFVDDRDTLFWLNAAVGALCMVVIALFGLGAGGLQTAQGFALIALAPLPFLLVPTAWWEAQLVRKKRVRAASLYVLVAEASALAMTIVMLQRGWGIEALIAPRYLSLLVGIIITGGLVKRLPRLRLRRATASTASTTAFPLWGTTSVHLFTNYGTDIILGAFASASVIGAYRGGARIAMTASDLVLQPLGVLSWSKFSRIEKEEVGIRPLRDAWVANMSIAAAILWPMSTTVALLAPELVSTILDETWLPAAGVVSILSVSRAISFLSALLEPTLMTTGRGRHQFAIRLLGAGTLLLLLLIFARYGAEAAGYAHLTSSALVAVISMTVMVRALHMSFRQLIGTFVPGLGLATAIAAVIVGTEMSPDILGNTAGLAAQLAAAAVVWSLLMLLFLKRRVLVLPTP
ncbi:O-antigen/teichoic acid export membrane protein [Rhodovulum iodosum]|uniref:O-antigen/teichoic acid export membrane protein n=1 Tax=Rhodovulum iodosum TaxID=68291 RepID=A0ABV3XWE5_9RHOB|nr:oligosaccharide flippase family protein [Rhodovulum robiginosum]RSK38352.1 translocase [Rhodovulum robiginosum]